MDRVALGLADLRFHGVEVGGRYDGVQGSGCHQCALRVVAQLARKINRVLDLDALDIVEEPLSGDAEIDKLLLECVGGHGGEEKPGIGWKAMRLGQALCRMCGSRCRLLFLAHLLAQEIVQCGAYHRDRGELADLVPAGRNRRGQAGNTSSSSG